MKEENMKQEKLLTDEKQSNSENLYSIEINLDGAEDDLSIMSAHLTNAHKQYIFKSAEELRDLDQRIKLSIKEGNPNTIEFLQTLYNNRLTVLCSYMDRAGITYSMGNKMRDTAEKKIAQKNHEKQCPQCRKRHVAVRRERLSKGYERQLERKK